MLLLKQIHIGCVLLTFMSFFGRGVMRFYRPDWLAIRWIKVVPHLIDTILLISAIGLARYWLHAQQPWLIAKIVALIAYVVLGHIALDLKHERQTSATALGGALLMFLYMVSVAQSKSVFGPFA